jgi:hypothetical protein
MTCPIPWQKEQSGEIYGEKPLTLKIGVTRMVKLSLIHKSHSWGKTTMFTI